MHAAGLERRDLRRSSDFSPSRPRVLVVLPSFIPSTQIYVVKPILALHRLGRIDAEIALEYTVSYRSVVRAEVLILCRNTEPDYDWILDVALNENKPLIYELDDNFFEILPTTKVGRYHCAPERLRQLERYLIAANLVRVYSDVLAERVVKLNQNVVRTEGPVDWSLIPGEPKRSGRDKVRLVYATSRIEDDLASLFIDDVRQLTRQYDGRVEIFFWGYHPPELRGYPAVHFLPLIRNYDAFFRKFARSGFDIGLAPLLDDVFSRSKSNVKFREYAACGIAGVYSEVAPYSGCVVHELTGLMVKNHGDGWLESVTRLVEDASLRRRIQKNGWEFARRHYDLRFFQEVLWSQIQNLLHEDKIRVYSSHKYKNRRDMPESRYKTVPASSGVRARHEAFAKWVWIRWGLKVIQHVRKNALSHTWVSIRRYLNDLTFLIRLKVILRYRYIRRAGPAMTKNSD